MRTTMTLAANYNCSPFDVLNQDVDDVLVILSFYLDLPDTDEKTAEVNTKQGTKEKRIRVNDKTATGGWW